MDTNNPKEVESKTVNPGNPSPSNSDILMIITLAAIAVIFFASAGYYWYTNPDLLTKL